ncbi:MAG TPA: D-threitol dehydrogenase [Candidatus Nesterenkonia stercoripullorum]|uniref:D-threitol dehydrogenase n=1 Tax=Candidatus Nesterenkonia stercoripullorum TaxID=2838701 RepID=A0A9D1S0L3_9MICC|nr:D-threitol dehydrogenase [Candidatus Nesterenkonia stercoripullorum]
MTERFTDRTVVITGAGQGIGWAVAEHFAAEGARVVGVDVAESIAERMSELPGAGHIGIRQDLTSPTAAEDVMRDVDSSTDGASVLVNSAGVGLIAPAGELSAETWTTTIAVNLSASFFMAQAAGRRMVERGFGRVVNISSQAAELGLAGHAAYSASKAGVLGFTRVMAVEWAGSGVTVNAVSPTIVGTELGKRVWSGERGEAARAEIPAGRFAEPEEVAALVGFVASAEAAMITGENIRIDGGRSVI